MPSASSKTDVKAASDQGQPIKLAIQVVEKKVRNLEKRKGKLDAYKDKESGGEILNKDQLEAVSKYDSVLMNLEFAKELQKQFLSISAEADKSSRKALKHEKHEKTADEQKRVQKLLQIQVTLDSLGADDVRKDFLEGNEGAVKLTEENLNSFDELYKLISPTRDLGSEYQEAVTAASEHITSLLDGRDKAVADTTYKALRELVDKVIDCGYFDKPAEENKTEDAEDTKPESKDSTPAVSKGKDAVKEKNTEKETTHLESTFSAPHSQSAVSADVPTSVPVNTTHSEASLLIGGTANNVTTATSEPITNQFVDHHHQGGTPASSREEEEEYFMSTLNANQRGLNEIVSSVQGNFDFLQDSYLHGGASAAKETAHIDPAVVVALPQTDSTFQHSNLLSDGIENSSMAPQPPSMSEPSAPQHSGLPHQPPMDAYGASQPGQDYSQNYVTQPVSESQLSFGSVMLDQGISSNSSTDIPEPPPAIPMPNESPYTMDQQQAMQQEAQEKKMFIMNPNAAMFQSRYSNQGEMGMSHDGHDKMSHQQHGMQHHQQQDYQGGFGGPNNYNRNGNMNRGPRGGGSNNNNARQGGSANQRNNAMSNGYSRGGGGGANGPSRGGAGSMLYNNSNNRGGGGGGNYNGSGGRGGGGGGNQQRGGRGGSRGGGRGGSSNMRGANTGAPRGGYNMGAPSRNTGPSHGMATA